MNRIDRLLALLLELQGREWVQAQELAQHFEVSVRTIYRDVAALHEAGVPVVSVPGRGYSLLEGYFLPPLHFTVSEAVMLAFGVDAVQTSFDAEYAQAAAMAQKKLLTALPDQRREAVEHLRTQIHLVPANQNRDLVLLASLRRALLDRVVVTFIYQKPNMQPEQRRVSPLSLAQVGGVWLLHGFDHLRQALRNFRPDRMSDLKLLSEHFEPDPAWEVAHAEDERRNQTVRLGFALDDQHLVEERPHFFQTAATQQDGLYLVTLQVRELQDILPWVLSWGGRIKWLEPLALQKLVKQEAQKMLDVLS